MSQTQKSTSHLCWFTKLDTQAELIITGRLFSSFLKLLAALLNHRSPGPFSSRNNKLLSLLLLPCPFGSICQLVTVEMHKSLKNAFLRPSR